jgi:hypothetical protein
MVLFARRTLQSWAQSYISRKLNEAPDLEGSLGGVEFALLRGEVILRRIHLAKLSGGRKLVEARCEEVCIHIQWRPLLHGILVGKASLRAPHVQIRGGAQKKQEKKGKEKVKADASEALLDFIRQAQRLTPFRLHLLKATEGRVDYVSYDTTPPFKLTLDEFSLSAVDLTNIPDPGGKTIAHISLAGRTTGNGQFWFRLILPSPRDTLTFELQAGLERVNLVDLNDLLRAYAKFDVKRGVCSVYSEFTVENGHYRGKVQPRFQDLDVFAWQKEHSKGFLQICRQALIAIVASLFKNRSRDELALNIGITGTFEDTDVDVWAAVGSLLGNAFRQSLFNHASEAEARTEAAAEAEAESDSSGPRWRRLIPWKATAR